jgi:hypothetical protein
MITAIVSVAIQMMTIQMMTIQMMTIQTMTIQTMTIQMTVIARIQRIFEGELRGEKGDHGNRPNRW